MIGSRDHPVPESFCSLSDGANVGRVGKRTSEWCTETELHDHPSNSPLGGYGTLRRIEALPAGCREPRQARPSAIHVSPATAGVLDKRSDVDGDPKNLADLYRQMLVIRRAEERLQKLFANGEIPGFLHLSIGQEAVAAGVSSALRSTDTVASTHRGHGHALAKGVALPGFFAEIMGRASGVCGGRGGSMHVADLSIGMLGANGIVAAGIPIATGSALALKIKDVGDVAVVYFGDGALAEGVVHECLNVSALWSLPVLFVCENNGWSEFSPIERQLATDMGRLATAFGIEHADIDGNDVLTVSRSGEESRRVDARSARPASARVPDHAIEGTLRRRPAGLPRPGRGLGPGRTRSIGTCPRHAGPGRLPPELV